MSISFLSLSSFDVPNIATGKIGIGFLMCWSRLFLRWWLYWRIKFVTSWCFRWIILLCVQSVLLLCLKFRICNIDSALLKFLCTIFTSHDVPMCALCWVSCEHIPWCLVVLNVFYCSQTYFPTLRMLRSWCCILMILACSTWFVLDKWVCYISILGTYFQSQWDPIQIVFSMSWYLSPPNFFCEFLVVPIYSLSGLPVKFLQGF